MQTVLVTIVFFGIIVSAMAIGVIFTGKSLRGSCGGTGTDCECTETKRRACATAARESASS
jgi:hypothetical protein